MIDDQSLSLLSAFLVGVCSKWIADFLYNNHRNRKRRGIFREAFRSEIEDSIRSLERNELELLPHAIWDVASYSGALELFDADQVIELSRAYTGNKNMNYEATRTRDLSVIHATELSPERQQKIREFWVKVTLSTREMGRRYLETLRQLLNRKWLRPKK